jgi:O-antigen ligase/Tfp pilus assembly protein PilF
MRFSISTCARAILFGLLLGVPLVFTGATLEAFETPKVALLQLSAILLAALAVVAFLNGGGLRQWSGAIPLAVLGFLASAVISSVFSISPHTSFFGGIDSLAGLTTLLSFAVVLFAARGFVSSPEQARRMLVAPVIAAGLASAYAIVQALRVDPYPWHASSSVGGFVRPFATLGHANLLGGYLVATLPLVVYFSFRARGRGRVAGAIVTAMTVLAIVLTLTRGAWLTLGVLLVGGAVALYRAGHRRIVGLGIGAAVCALVLGWFAVGPALRQGLAERLSHFSQSAGRMPLWRSGLAMVAEHPFVGVGLDAYPLAFGRHRSPDYWLTEWNSTPTRAHNEIVQVTATQGLIGLVALAAIVVCVVVAVWRSWQAGSDRGLTIALGASLLAFGVQSMFSFTVAATGSLAAVIVGILASLSSAEASRTAEGPAKSYAWLLSFPFTPASFAMGVAAAWLAWIGIVRPLQADVECRRAECVSLVDPVRALNGFEAAVARAPERELLWFKLSQGARAAARVTSDSAGHRRFNDRARAAQQHAVKLVPQHPGHRAHYARLVLDLFREGQATAGEVDHAFRDALNRDPNHPGLLGEAGQAAWARGDHDLARHYLRQGMDLDPEQANLRALSGLVAMAEGHFEEAEQQFDAAIRRNWHGNENGHLQALTVWAACLVKLNRTGQAEEVSRGVLDYRPDWPGPRFTLAYALGMLGRHGEAQDEYRELIARCPAHPLAKEAQRELRKLEPR